jgi:hypothetical protein
MITGLVCITPGAGTVLCVMFVSSYSPVSMCIARCINFCHVLRTN